MKYSFFYFFNTNKKSNSIIQKLSQILTPYFNFYFLSEQDIFKHVEAETNNFDFVLFDLEFLKIYENQEKSSLLKLISQKFPQTVILVTNTYDNPCDVLFSLKMGAHEYISQSCFGDQFLSKLSHLRQRLFPKKNKMSSPSADPIRSSHIAGRSMAFIADRIPHILNSAVRSIYIHGESGTGKEVVADLVSTGAAPAPFLKINCAAISPDLIESELFGHKKGSFTGAVQDKKGLIEMAHGGWIFLDEVASLPLSAQGALLRCLENQEIMPIGATMTKKVNVKFVAASNILLEDLVYKGEFRNDLLQRLRETEINLLPLRERKDEIIELINHFSGLMEGGPYIVDQAAMQVLCHFDWKEGNIRQLRNCLRAMTENHSEKILSPMCIPDRYFSDLQSQYKKQPFLFSDLKADDDIEKQAEDDWERYTFEELAQKLLSWVVRKHKTKCGRINISRLSKQLGLSRTTLQTKLKQLSL